MKIRMRIVGHLAAVAGLFAYLQWGFNRHNMIGNVLILAAAALLMASSIDRTRA